MTAEELEEIVIRFMDRHTTMTLACCSQGAPWAAAVYYARRDWDLVFFSSPTSIHSRAFAENPVASAEIHGECDGWRDIKGLQMEGRVEAITSPTTIAASLAVYTRRYPFVKEFFSDPSSISLDMASKMSRVALFKFCPSAVKYLDNELGFGQRWRLEILNGRVSPSDPIRD